MSYIDGLSVELMQIGGGGFDLNMIIFYLLFFLVMPILWLRMNYWQSLLKLESVANQLTEMSANAKKIVLKKISKNPDARLKQQINNFMEFFVIEPVSLDPYGIMRKIEHLVDLSEQRFESFVDKVAPKANEEMQANLMMGLSGALTLHQIEKIIRHYVELVKKTKNIQLALIFTMQLPLIERVAKALLSGTEALTNGWMIGDAAGSLTAAHMIGTSRAREIEKDVLAAKKRIGRRSVYILKAKGPGGRLGKLGKAVEKIAKRNRVAKIITIDAAAKLEGERTGSIAEGVGVAIGGPGVDRSRIENLAVGYDIPVDSYVIKMAPEEAIMPIKKEVLAAVPRVIENVEENVRGTREKGLIIIVGVGNTGGVGNDKRSAQKAEYEAKKILEMMKRREKKEKKKRDWFGWMGG